LVAMRRRRRLIFLVSLCAVTVAASPGGASSVPDNASRRTDTVALQSTRDTTAARTRCSRYAAPGGRDSGGGWTPRRAVSLQRATRIADPGQTVCLLGGIYRISSSVTIKRSGRAGSPITFARVGKRPIIKWPGGRYGVIQVMPGTHHIVLRGLTLVGGNTGLRVNDGAHHVRALRNRIRGSGVTGIGVGAADHVVISQNRIFHVGYGRGWGSGIGFQGHAWIDRKPGFHSVVTLNVISGTSDESDHHSDGNGVIVEDGGDIPPILIANNVIYHNGGRCIHNLNANNVWVVNNTCFVNGLDRRLGDDVGELSNFNAENIHLVNNLVRTRGSRYPVKVVQGSTAVLRRNVVYGGRISLVPKSVLDDPGKIRVLRPGFVRPPALREGSGSPQARALPPWRLGNGLALQAGAAPVGKGVDPRDTPGTSPAIRRGLTRYALLSMSGVRRPLGRFDVGAYER